MSVNWKKLYPNGMRIRCNKCGYTERTSKPPSGECVKCPQCGKKSLPKRRD